MKQKIKSKRWKEIDSKDASYTTYTLPELLSWIDSKVPQGTSKENIRLSFEAEIDYDYYNNPGVSAKMILEVNE